MNCSNFTNLMQWQSDMLREHISKDRYYLGEQGIKVTFIEAEAHFLLKHFERVAKEMRLEYCTTHCTVSGCDLRQMFIKKDS